MRISADRCHPCTGYLKLVTSSNFWPLMLIYALMLFALLVMTEVKEWTGLEFAKSVRTVENREVWRKLVVCPNYPRG